VNFNQIFDTNNTNVKLNEPRDKFLSRIFGIFNEEIVRIWCRSKNSEYQDLGRPTVYERDRSIRGSTLDFTLKEKQGGKTYVSEMKCEIQFENFKYFQLNKLSQLNHHNKTAFNRFLGVAKDPKKFVVRVKGKETKVHGAILIWGKTDPDAIEDICKSKSLNKILSLEDIINDLIEIENQEYFELLNQKKEWINYLLTGLKN